MAMLLTYGILAVAESMIAKKQIQYATQASANAGAYVYGRTYIQELDRCIKEKILEQLEEDDGGLEREADADLELPSCSSNKLRQCAETDFEECDLELNSCWEEEVSPINICLHDDRVRQAASAAAREKAHQLARQYDLEHIHIAVDSETANVSADKRLETKVPRFGVSRYFSSSAKSKIVISQMEESE